MTQVHIMKTITIGDRKYVRDFVLCVSCDRRIFYTLLPEVYHFLIHEDIMCYRCDPKRLSIGIDIQSVFDWTPEDYL